MRLELGLPSILLAGCATQRTQLAGLKPCRSGTSFCTRRELFNMPDGSVQRGVTLRAFDPKTRKCSIWWLDGNKPTKIDVPGIGRFEKADGLHTDRVTRAFAAITPEPARPLTIFARSLICRDRPLAARTYMSNGAKWRDERLNPSTAAPF